MIRRLIAALVLLILTACEKKNDKLFTKLDPAVTGINFNNRNVEAPIDNILTYEYFYNGGGVALGDINNDGLLDIYFSSNQSENKLFLNEGNLTFKDITASANAGCASGWKTGVTMVDINNDGWLDIYVCRSKDPDPAKRRNSLLINNKDLTFSEQAEKYGLADDSYTTQASFFDYDRDGDLDAFLLNHSLLDVSNQVDIRNRNTTVRTPYVGNKLFRNDGGTFVDVSDSLGIYGPASNYGLGVSTSDVNNDGWVDIYAGSDFTGRDKLLINRQGEFFVDSTDRQLSHISKFTMGTDIADINGDGLEDIVTLDMLPEDNLRQKVLLGADKYNVFNQMVQSGLHHQYMRNMLHLNTGNGYFAEVGQIAGISNTDWSWCPLLADFDNDGAEDLFISNGFKRDLTNGDFAKYHAYQIIEENWKRGIRVNPLDIIGHFQENKIHNYIFKGDGQLQFSNVYREWGLEESNITNGAAYGDLDNDGDLDLVMNHLNDVAGIYRNNANESGNHFVEMKLKGSGKNDEAIGAKITVFTNNKQLTRELFPVRGFQSSVDPVLHIGLGKTEKLDSVIVRWPSGRVQHVQATVDKRLEIVESGTSLPFDAHEGLSPMFTNKSDVIRFVHHENSFVDFNTQPLLPRMYSTMGPALAMGDVNGDGLNDLYVGGAKDQAGALLIQNKEGTFLSTQQPDFINDQQSEDVDAVFFDADGDRDLDLYVASGGYEFEAQDKNLQDRLYLNDGKGHLRKGVLPVMHSSKSCVRPSDIDNDGDLDLFIGGRIIPGRYPESPQSNILLNDGKGNFSIAEIADDLKYVGMVTDAIWCDLTGDHVDDLVLVGEWMPVEVFVNDHGTLTKKTKTFFNEATSGWWNCIQKYDFDRDGDDDFIAGNAGINNCYQVTAQRPATLYFSDYDNNGSVDPIINYFIMDKQWPYPAGDELMDQLPSFRKRFHTNTEYANNDISHILTPDELLRSKRLDAFTMRSVYLRNDGGHFSIVSLPIELQIAPVFSIQLCDVNHDGNEDFIAMGNLSGTRSRTGKLSGNSGFVFLGNGKGDFRFVSPQKTGLRVTGDVRHAVMDGTRMFVALNNDAVQVYQLNSK